jgi:hypothetical protein
MSFVFSLGLVLLWFAEGFLIIGPMPCIQQKPCVSRNAGHPEISQQSTEVDLGNNSPMKRAAAVTKPHDS